MELNASDAIIRGELSIPDNAVGLAILLHNVVGCDRDLNGPSAKNYNGFKMLSQMLFSAGITSFRFDKRGYGESSGVFADDLLTYTKDALAVYTHITQNYEAEKVFLIGQSRGTSVIALNFKDFDTVFPVGGVAAIAPAVFGEKLDPISCPLKIIVGSKDVNPYDPDLKLRTVVPCKKHRQLYPTEASFSILNGLTHILSAHGQPTKEPVPDPKAYQETADWIVYESNRSRKATFS